MTDTYTVTIRAASAVPGSTFLEAKRSNDGARIYELFGSPRTARRCGHSKWWLRHKFRSALPSYPEVFEIRA